ncbi:MAG: hypothetical protein ACYTG0_20630 [Planctomycetota bacterium]|jgi:hypothetical protein
MTMTELERAVEPVDAPAFLVASRVLRRVIRQHRLPPGFRLDVPHGDVFVIAREPLLETVELDELGPTADVPLPERVILVRRPEADELENRPAGKILTQCWRRIFHGTRHGAPVGRTAPGAGGAFAFAGPPGDTESGDSAV